MREWRRTRITVSRETWQRLTEHPYNAEDDFAKSIDEAYRVIRERKAAGGKGWPE
jgi:hypothetical protein